MTKIKVADSIDGSARSDETPSFTRRVAVHPILVPSVQPGIELADDFFEKAGLVAQDTQMHTALPVT